MSTNNIYVNSQIGNDRNTGSYTSPLASLGQAQIVARSLFNFNSKDVTINITGSQYLTSALTFSSLDNGLIIQAAPGQSAIISGGIQVKNWSPRGLNNIWAAPLTNFTRNVWVNNTRANRVKNYNGLPAGTVVNGTTGYTLGSSLPYSHNVSDIELVTRVAWSESRVDVATLSGTSMVMKSPAQTNLYTYLSDASTFYLPFIIENAWEDFIGQASRTAQTNTFYWDSVAGVLYLNPANGCDPNYLTVIAGQLPTVLNITGSYITIGQGISVSHTTTNLANSTTGYSEFLSGVYVAASGWVPITTNSLYAVCPKMASAINVNGASNFQMTGAILSRLGTCGITIGGATQTALIEGNIFADISCTGMFIGDPSDWNSSPLTNAITISNNYITKVGQEYHGGSGIWGIYQTNSICSNNEVTEVPYSAIQWGYGWGDLNTIPTSGVNNKNNSITTNFISSCMQQLNDGGGIYYVGWQGGLTITGNYVNLSNSGSANSYLGNGGSLCQGLYAEQGTRGVTVTNNVMSGVTYADLFLNPVYGDLIISGNYLGDGQSSISNDSNGAGIRGGMINGTQGAVTFTLGSNYYNDLYPAAQTIMQNAGLQSAYQFLLSTKY